MKLIIEDDEGRKTVVPLVRDEISIGRLEGNTIRLTERNVSRRHARLMRQNGAVFIEDLGSYTGVRVNGEKISSRHSVKEGDLIEIGDYDLQIEGALEKSGPDTNPTVKEDMGHIHAPKDRTPPLAAAMPATVPAAPMPRQVPQNQSSAQPPSTTKKSEATAMIRLSDLSKGGEADTERDLSSNEQPRLVGLSGAFRGKDFPLRRSVVKIGRDDGNDLVIDHQSMSRNHAKFQMEGGVWKLYDNKSANGIRVNGDEYGMSPVKAGDTIELGHVKFRFCAPGERFVPPPEAPVAAPPPAVTQVQAPQAAPAKNNLPLIIGGVVVVVVIAVAAVLILKKNGGGKSDEGAQYCAAGQMAIGQQNWAEAVKQLNIAKTMNLACPFPLEDALKNARANNDAKQNLDDADQLIQEGKFRQAIPILKGIPDGTVYDAERKLKLNDAKKAGIRKYSAEAQDAIDKGKLDEAQGAIGEIASLDPDAESLPLLQNALREKRSKIAAANARPADPPPAPKKPQAERDAIAEKKLADANGLIKGGNLQGGIDMLKQVLNEEPSVPLQGKAWRNLGVAYARGGNTDEAKKCYRMYLKLVPDAPEREKILQLIGP